MDSPSVSGPVPKRAAPYFAFRIGFALVNAALWFVLTLAITTPVATGLQSGGGPSSGALITTASAIAFFVCFFGRTGALGGFLEQAEKGVFTHPRVPSRPPGDLIRPLADVWRTGTLHGLLAALLVAALGLSWLSRGGALSTLPLSAQFARLAAAVAFLEAFVVAGPATMGVRRSAGVAGPPPGGAYFLARFALPEGAGNGMSTALIAVASFGPATVAKGASEVQPGLALAAFVGDAFATGFIIALFMVGSAGDLAAADRRYGLIGGLSVAPPSRLRRAGLVLVTGVACAALALPIAATVGASLPLYVAWKGLVGAIVGGGGAALAARWTLGGPPPAARPASRASDAAR